MLYRLHCDVAGSAADVCELQTKDEVVSINGQSIAQLTSAELEQKVKNAVSVGQIELRVKRYLGSRGGKSCCRTLWWLCFVSVFFFFKAKWGNAQIQKEWKASSQSTQFRCSAMPVSVELGHLLLTTGLFYGIANSIQN